MRHVHLKSSTKISCPSSLAEANGLSCIANSHAESVQADNKAAGVTWTKLVFEKR